jgi:two-component system response regulator YesN
MYSILVVDDEPISADGIAHCLREYDSEEWEILCAYSPHHALEKAENRIDILLTDITMPNIDGYELYNRILNKWPRCKVIYFTGNISLHYAQRAIRNKGVVDYILKTETESVIIKAVSSAIVMLEDEIKGIAFQNNMIEQIKMALPVLRKEYLSGLLLARDQTWNRERKFIQLEISLDANREIFLIYGKVEASDDSAGRSFELITMDAVMQMTMSDAFSWNSVQLESNSFVYFIQPKDFIEKNKRDKISYILLPYIELVQESMKRISVDISIIMDREMCGWDDAPSHYRMLIDEFGNKMPIPNALFIYNNTGSGRGETRLPEKISTLGQFIEQGKARDARDLLRELLKENAHEKVNRIKSYAALVSLFAKFVVTKEDIPPGLCFPSLEEEGFDIKTENAFLQLLSFLTDKSPTQNKSASLLVEEINRYVDEELGKNLSMSMVAEHFNFSSAYFSRLYKHITGENFVKYVLKRKLTRGMELLQDENLKINDIARIVGYWSPSYFIREFRKMYGITPAEYRRVNNRSAFNKS